MGGAVPPTALERARDAVSRQDWSAACEQYAQADALATLGADDLPLYAGAAYGCGLLEACLDAWERAYGLALKDGDRISAAAAAVRVALHLLIDTGLMAPVRAWATRVERLLEGESETPVHAWLAMVRMYERLLSGDFDGVEHWAAVARDRGERQREPAVVALGCLAEARRRIFQGDVDGGIALLDEAALATVSGELDPLSVGMVYCEILCACRGIGQIERAEEWTDAMERWRDAHGVGSLGGRCRVHRAELLHLRGESAAAEREAAQACEELRPYLRMELGWPLTELGRIRLRRGDLAGAARALYEAHEIGWDAQPALAMLRLAEGDVAGAAASIRDALEHPLNVPSKELPPNNELRRAPLLEAAVEIEIAAGQIDRAVAASASLDAIAAQFGGRSLAAGAALARGRVEAASGRPSSAVREFHEALRLFNEIGAPYDAAVARTGLASAYRDEGNGERAALELRAANAVFERVAASHAPIPVPSHVSGPADAGTENSLRREGDYWSVVYAGQTIRVKHRQGMIYLAALLADPGREHHVLDLVGSTKEAAAGDAGEMLDAQAKEAYRRRLAEIDEDRAEAEANADLGRIERGESERAFMLRELSRAVGITGTDRRAGAASERARASVTQAIRITIAKIAEHHGLLGEHLLHAIRTGTYCSYAPDPGTPVVWQL